MSTAHRRSQIPLAASMSTHLDLHVPIDRPASLPRYICESPPLIVPLKYWSSLRGIWKLGLRATVDTNIHLRVLKDLNHLRYQ